MSVFINSLETASAVSRELMRLMKILVDNYNNVLTLLKLDHFSPLLEYFDFQARKTMSIHIVNNALDNETIITTPEQVSSNWINVLFYDFRHDTFGMFTNLILTDTEMFLQQCEIKQ